MNKYILGGFLGISLILNGSVFAQSGGSSSTYSGANIDYNHQENDEQSNKNNGMPAYPNIPTGAMKNKSGPVNRSQATDY
jgi:hypothetical protein